MSTSTITRKGQVTIPKEIRDALDLTEGQRVLFVRRGDEVVLKVIRGNILALRGSVKPSKRPENFEKVRAAVKKKLASRVVSNG
ncbi:MAG: AbrB/MazE/SpoVT family DNA-binding domain-containing protein [Acidobacteria bacterium]|jgi:AbrB family looped-hinge helix DNA binding protein|nr:MAG: AbrB/MazE/SpoVT family DNA-binding domain-containing protein [Acidobacteriota bacterium]